MSASAEIERVVDAVRFKLEDMLKMDARIAYYIYENEKKDRRFSVVAVEGEEMIMRIGPAECVEKSEDGCYVAVALTVSEAIALALRLIRHAAKIYVNKKAAAVRV
jgi:hypothetical protein